MRMGRRETDLLIALAIRSDISKGSVLLLTSLFSTMLPRPSNHCMPCCFESLGEDINKCHFQQIWLEVGIQSTRNLANR